jgi:hypothetical protein
MVLAQLGTKGGLTLRGCIRNLYRFGLLSPTLSLLRSLNHFLKPYASIQPSSVSYHMQERLHRLMVTLMEKLYQFQAPVAVRHTRRFPGHSSESYETNYPP